MKRINYYNASGQMNLTDRIAIEVGLGRGESFKKIGERIRRHPSTIAHEVKNNRTKIIGLFPYGNDCKYAKDCHRKVICEDKDYCNKICARCFDVKCSTVCSTYVSNECFKVEWPPYVCNNCPARKKCEKTRYMYSAQYAQEIADRRRSDCRKGARTDIVELLGMDALVTKLVRKGQPLTHIYAEHEDEIPISLRSLYNYIDAGWLSISNIDLRRKTSYKPRKKKKDKNSEPVVEVKGYRDGRTYDAFESMLEENPNTKVTEMDTVLGNRKKGKRLLTMIFVENSVMLMFLMPDGKADSVKEVFDYLEAGLGLETFNRLFGTILTDNGSEFKRVDDLEQDNLLHRRTQIYYCDPMASWQKAHIEKNHEYIRYVIPKGVSLTPYTQEDITLLMNHINSTIRKSLGHRAPYELLDRKNPDIKALWKLLKMDLIPPDEVHLMPDLFVKHK